MIGTRAAMFAPVADLGLVVVWDDGDDLHAEPRAPYPHVRRCWPAARPSRRGLLVGGLRAPPRAPPLVGIRLGPIASRAAGARCAQRRAAGAGRRRRRRAGRRRRPPGPPGCRAWPGAPPATRCAAARCSCRCRAAATCPGWPARAAARRPGARPATARSGTAAVEGTPQCRVVRPPGGGLGLPALRRPRGSGRPPSEPPHGGGARPGLPRAPVRTPGGDSVLAAVGPRAGPRRRDARRRAGGRGRLCRRAAPRRLGAARRAPTCAPTRRRCGAGWGRRAGPARAGDGGAVVVLADSEAPAVQALVRWDPATFAERELAERADAAAAARRPGRVADRRAARRWTSSSLPPSCRSAAEVLGPVAGRSRTAGDDGLQRLIVRVPRRQAGAGRGPARRRRGAQRAQGRRPGALQVDPLEMA